MNKNEYRRAFIMLRPAAQGYGGHARLERRTLTGSLYFIVTAPQQAGQLTALLAGQRNGEYYAAKIGQLARDRRGQLTLAWQFDPRGIDGRPLEAYAWAVVAEAGSPCAVVLTGNVEGSRALDPQALSRAVCALLTPETQEEPAADLPEEAPAPPAPTSAPEPTPAPCETASTATVEAPPAVQSAPVLVQTQPVAESAPAPCETASTATVQTPPAVQSAPILVQSPHVVPPTAAPSEAPAEPEPAHCDVKIYTRSRKTAPAATQPVATEAPAAPASEPTVTPQPAQPTPVTAAEVLGLSITSPWPGAAEPLRRLFATQAPTETALGDGYTYVTAPMPAGCGYPHSLIGLRAGNGNLAAIRYALPAPYAPEPPAGLEGYAWRQAEPGRGYWVLDTGL